MPSRVSANFIRAKSIPSAATMVVVSHVIMLSACVGYTLFHTSNQKNLAKNLSVAFLILTRGGVTQLVHVQSSAIYWANQIFTASFFSTLL